MTLPDWKQSLPQPPEANAQLQHAWLTSYDRPDTSFLVEYFLPSLLGMNAVLTEEPGVHDVFFGSLGMALEALKGAVTIISSSSNETGLQEPYAWLWQYINSYTVGARADAVQHAKFWAFHWKTDDGELLELYVSSANLTASAFKNQVQAGWHIQLPLEPGTAKTRLAKWGDLVHFLNALGESAGVNANEAIEPLLTLLARAHCPDDVTFIASIPGATARAANKLKKLKPVEMHILTPTIGDWTDKTLAAWSHDTGVPLQNIHLKWISPFHPWAAQAGWALTDDACTALKNADVKLEQLQPGDRFVDEHFPNDERWSHAKLYLMRIPPMQYRQLLITSANWSAAAWGAGASQSARNFELGVLVRTKWKLLESMCSPLAQPFLTQRSTFVTSALRWVQASWDGHKISLSARSTKTMPPIVAHVLFSDNSVSASHTLQKGTIEFGLEFEFGGASESAATAIRPLSARFSQGDEQIQVYMLDLRPREQFCKDTPLPEIDPEHQERVRDALLLERYGGPVVDTDPPPDPTTGDNNTRNSKKTVSPHRMGGSHVSADYTVQAWSDARAGFVVLDNWRRAWVAAGKNDVAYAQYVRGDGEHLQRIFEERASAGTGDTAARLIAEEFKWHLESSV